MYLYLHVIELELVSVYLFVISREYLNGDLNRNPVVLSEFPKGDLSEAQWLRLVYQLDLVD